MEQDESRNHCWECLRRKLVCDFARPGCDRCTRSGITCPGYGVKPVRLKWLAPGQVKARNRKRRIDRDEETTEVPALFAMDGDIPRGVGTNVHVFLRAAEYCQ
jgi:hypothetical protein